MEEFILGNEEARAISKRKEEARNFCYKELNKTWMILAASIGSLILGGLGFYAFLKDGFNLLIFIYIIFILFGLLGIISCPSEIIKINAKIKDIEFNLDEVEAYIVKQKELQQKIQAIEDERKTQEAVRKAKEEARKREQYQYDHPECPVCKSHNTSRISTLNRAVSVGVAGLASSKIGKQYECYHCKHKW